MRYHIILEDFVRNYAIPAMQERGWIWKAAKSYGWKHAMRGPDYHVDQSLCTHILNGSYALTRVLEYLQHQGYYHVSEKDFKTTLVLYLLHDAYKDSDLARQRTSSSEFSVPLSALENLYESMGLSAFVAISAQDLRAASVSLLSPKVADLSSSQPGVSRLHTLVHLADALASQQTASDCGTAENRVREISRDDAVTARQNTRVSKRMAHPVQDVVIRPELKFYYHELDDYRGLSTLSIHQATEDALAPYGLYPILYFANGILYLGPKDISLDISALRRIIANSMLSKIKEDAGDESYTLAEEACQFDKRLKFRKDAFLFSPLPQLIQVIQNYRLAKKAAGFLTKVVEKRVANKKYSSLEAFYNRFSIPLGADTEEFFAQRWNAAYYIFMGIENIAETLVPEDSTEWLFSTFHTPSHVAEAIREHRSLLRTGGVADHCLIIAYHWLIDAKFLADARTALQVDIIDIQQALGQQAIRALAPYDKEERRLAFVNEELSLQSDIGNYLQTNLVFSFHTERIMDDNRLKTYERERTRSSHKRTCILCNRDIPIKMKSSNIITGIAGQQAQVFSNKLQPSQEVKGQMVWCPMCYLEFMLRKMSGQSYPAGSDYNASYRLHLYVLPDYSFTPQLWEYTSQQVLKNFYPKETAVTRLLLRGSKEDPGLPSQWLEHRSIDQEWLEHIRDMFAQQAARLKMPDKEGRRRGRQGDRMTFSFKNPNYMLITYDNVVFEKADKGLTPTHIEVWAKALYAALLIHLLTGARVYLTDKPYLSITRPEQMKTIIEMDGHHPLLSGILPIRRTDGDATDDELPISENSGRLPLSTLPVMLDLLAAVWEINAGLYKNTGGERRNLDKQVANTLEEVKTNYFAGATLYKMRERDKASPYAAFTRACQILLPQQGEHADAYRLALHTEGYDVMLDKEGGYLMNLAERITNASLQLYRPRTSAKGRAHRFETLFRTGVEAIKNNASSSEDREELISRVAGTVLKRLERVVDSGGFAPTYGTERLEIVEAFATILVSDLFGKVCGGSVSKLTHEENRLADAVYFLTFQKVNRYWEEWKKQHPNENESADKEEELATSDM